MRKLILILVLLACHGSILALTLDEAVAMARVGSVDAAAALDELRGAYWQYRTYRAGLLPELTLNVTAPSFTRSFNRYQQADGSYTFVRSSSIAGNAELSVSQAIWTTGGTVSVSTRLDGMRQLGGERYNSFMAQPVLIRFSQPLFSVNTVKWNRRIEPVRYREARARFIEASQEVAMEAVRYFFNLLNAREALASSTQNLVNARRLYEAAQAKRAMGQISHNELLQIELTLLNAESDVAADGVDMRSAAMQLTSFLSVETVPDTAAITPVEPPLPPQATVMYADALQQALGNNPLAASIRRRQLEADYEVAKAKGNRRSVTLSAEIGLSGSDGTLSRAYGNLNDNSIVEIGISIPLMDWGKRRAAVRVAESKRELTMNMLRKEQTDFSQSLYTLVERFNGQAEQYRLARRACDIAQQRYDSMVETFLVGRISTQELADAQQSKDLARLNLLDELFKYWYYHYQLRSVTLYDFAERTTIDADIDACLGLTNISM